MELELTKRNLRRLAEQESPAVEDVLNFIYDFCHDIKNAAFGDRSVQADVHKRGSFAAHQARTDNGAGERDEVLFCVSLALGTDVAAYGCHGDGRGAAAFRSGLLFFIISPSSRNHWGRQYKSGSES